jgi:hypothetical protein
MLCCHDVCLLPRLRARLRWWASQSWRSTRPAARNHRFASLPQSILEYNGAAIVAMTGKNCVAIARCARRRWSWVCGNATQRRPTAQNVAVSPSTPFSYALAAATPGWEYRGRPWRATFRRCSRCTTGYTSGWRDLPRTCRPCESPPLPKGSFVQYRRTPPERQ